MRELKFKIYDKNDTKGIIGPFTWNKLPQFLFPENFTVLQYTGMIDRNGVEVYEGDIVAEKITEEMAANGDSAVVGVVYFAAGTFLIDGDGALYEHVFSDSPHILEDFIVIGNKFTNPELLK